MIIWNPYIVFLIGPLLVMLKRAALDIFTTSMIMGL